MNLGTHSHPLTYPKVKEQIKVKIDKNKSQWIKVADPELGQYVPLSDGDSNVGIKLADQVAGQETSNGKAAVTGQGATGQTTVTGHPTGKGSSTGKGISKPMQPANKGKANTFIPKVFVPIQSYDPFEVVAKLNHYKKSHY